jgi:hypothetical protein
LLDFDALYRSSWLSFDLCNRASDILSAGIVRMYFLVEPYSAVAILTANGDVAMCYIDPSKSPNDDGAYYWYKYSFDGNVKSICATSGSSGAVLWIAREYNGSLLIETINDAINSGIGIDGFIMSTADGSGVLTGLDVFEGQSVRVLSAPNSGNPLLVGDYTVDSGSVDLGDDYADMQLFVGTAIDNALETVKIEGIQKDGSSQVDSRRNNKITLRVNKSLLPIVNLANGDAELTDAQLAADSETIVTGDFKYVVAGHDDTILVTAESPFRHEINAIFSETESSRRANT